MTRWNPVVISRAIGDLAACTRLMGNPFLAYGYLRAKHNSRMGVFRVGSLHFQGRKEDWIAIREVLVEDEYSCIDRLFLPSAAPRILDLGANIGSFALRVFLRCPMAHVASVEAAGDTFKVLEANKQANASRSWQVLNNGVWCSDGPLILMRRGIPASHRVVEGGTGDAVHGISLDSLMSRLHWTSVDLIKMDIEGGEEAVVPAALDVLRRSRVLIIEVHSDRIEPVPILSALRSVYAFHWQLNDRRSNKPLYVMTNELLDLGAGAWRIEV